MARNSINTISMDVFDFNDEGLGLNYPKPKFFLFIDLKRATHTK